MAKFAEIDGVAYYNSTLHNITRVLSG